MIPAELSLVLYSFSGLAKRGAGFGGALLAMAARHGWDANAIAAVMCRESGFDPAARNPQSDASGLIQFMPATARNLGTTTAALRGMTAEAQLQYVERYFVSAFGARVPPMVGDYYMGTFYPSMVGKPAEAIIFQKGTVGYTQNVGLDLDRNGQITVGDVIEAVEDTYTAARARGPVTFDGGGPAAPPFPEPTKPGAASGGTGVDLASLATAVADQAHQTALLTSRVETLIARVEAGIVKATELVDRQIANTTQIEQLTKRLDRLEHTHAMNHPSRPAGAS